MVKKENNRMNWNFLNKIKTRKVRDYIFGTTIENKGRISNKEEMFSVINNITEKKTLNKEIIWLVNGFLKKLITSEISFSEQVKNHIYDKGTKEEKIIIDNFKKFIVSLDKKDKEKYIDEIIDFVRLFKRKGIFNSHYSFEDMMAGIFNQKENDLDFILKSTEDFYKRHYDNYRYGFSFGSAGFDFNYEKYYENLSLENKKIAQKKFMSSPVFFDFFLIRKKIFKENVPFLDNVIEKYKEFNRKQNLFLIDKDEVYFFKHTKLFLNKNFVERVLNERDYLATFSKGLSIVKEKPLNALVNAFIYDESTPVEEKKESFMEVLSYLKENKNTLIQNDEFYKDIYKVIQQEIHKKSFLLSENLIFIYKNIYDFFPEVFNFNGMDASFTDYLSDEKFKTVLFFFEQDLKHNRYENYVFYEKNIMSRINGISLSSKKDMDNFFNYLTLFSNIKSEENNANTSNSKNAFKNGYKVYLETLLKDIFFSNNKLFYMSDKPIDDMLKINQSISFLDDKNFMTKEIICGLIKYSLLASVRHDDRTLIDTVLERAKKESFYSFDDFFNYDFGDQEVYNDKEIESIVNLLTPYVNLLDIDKMNLISDESIKLKLKVAKEKGVLNEIISDSLETKRLKKRL